MFYLLSACQILLLRYLNACSSYTLLFMLQNLHIFQPQVLIFIKVDGGTCIRSCYFNLGEHIMLEYQICYTRGVLEMSSCKLCNEKTHDRKAYSNVLTGSF
jgi:hypothetical protein